MNLNIRLKTMSPNKIVPNNPHALEIRYRGVLIAYIDPQGNYFCLPANKKLVVQAINEAKQNMKNSNAEQNRPDLPPTNIFNFDV